jgi:hypothetical protein
VVEVTNAEPERECGPRDPMFLATASKSTPPEHKHPIPEHPQARKVSWHRIVVEVALYDRLDPSAGLEHGIVHALAGTLEKTTILETPGSGVALIDYDQDGWLDIYLVNGSTFAALKDRNRPRGRCSCTAQNARSLTRIGSAFTRLTRTLSHSECRIFRAFRHGIVVLSPGRAKTNGGRLRIENRRG